MTWQRAVLLVTGVIAAVFPAAANLRADEAARDLPISQVVMFSSGVAFFEHTGEVEGNARVDMRFHVRDINDLLKSMVLRDLGGGRIKSVAYGSQDPVTKTLQSFAIDLTTDPTLADLLSQIRGEKIELEAPRKIRGTILGVEKRKQPVGKDQVIEVTYLNLLTEDGLQRVLLDTAGKIKLVNPRLDAELRQALLVLAGSHDQEKKTVSLNFLGNGKRNVRVGYIQEAPIWKTSYRLVLGDDGPPHLQGWAIVENTTEADWKDVRLTLVSGRPISFVMDLYRPLYAERPVVEPERYASLRPPTYNQDLSRREEEFRSVARVEKQVEELQSLQRLQESEPKELAYRALGARPPRRPTRSRRMVEELAEAVELDARGEELGELFRYVIETPVTLERNRSAMLPIVNEAIEGGKVSIYNAAVHDKHPLNGLRLKNSTKLHLLQGPVTVFDGGSYAGDTRIEDLQPGSERLVSYALDLETEVAVSDTSGPTELIDCRLWKGTVRTRRTVRRSKTFTIKNSDRQAKTVLVEHPKEEEWKLADDVDATETTRDRYRFAVQAEPGKPATLAVREEQVRTESLTLSNVKTEQVKIYLAADVVSERVKEALRSVVQRKQELAKQAVQRTEMERQVKVIEQEQTRIRQNMQALPRDGELYRRYVTKFTEQEDQIDALRDRITAAIRGEAELKAALDQFLADLDVR